MPTADDRRVWLILLEDEWRRRQAAKQAQTAAGEQAAGRLIEQLLAMAERQKVETPGRDRAAQTERELALVAAVQEGGGWPEIAEMREKADRSPAETVALLLAAGDAENATRLLGSFA